MLDLLPAASECELVIPPLRPITVPAAPTGVALAAFAAGRDCEATEKERRVLRSVCHDWLPARPFSVLWSEAFTPERRLQAITAVVRAQTPDGALSDKEGTPEDWQTLVAQYRAAYHVSTDEVLSEPWAVFIGQLQEVGRLQAREQVRFLRAYTAIRGEDGKDILDDIIQSASADDEGGDELTEEEKEQRDRLAKEMRAEAWQTRQHILN